MKIAVLVTDDSEVLFGSPVMCGYLDDLVAVGKLFAADRARRPAPRQQALGDDTLLRRYAINARPGVNVFRPGPMARCAQRITGWRCSKRKIGPPVPPA